MLDWRRRRGGRVAEGARLESVYAGNRIEGSNPSPSAIFNLLHLLDFECSCRTRYGVILVPQFSPDLTNQDDRVHGSILGVLDNVALKLIRLSHDASFGFYGTGFFQRA